ncbi:hypothetical protein COOONC_23412, partial [Cooperia oncophora]
MISEQYDTTMLAHEYLCQGIQKLFESGITFNADCESRGSSSSFQQPFRMVSATHSSSQLTPDYCQTCVRSEEIRVWMTQCDSGRMRCAFDHMRPSRASEIKSTTPNNNARDPTDELVETFARFGSLVVDWPNKNETKSYFPPKGYVFLIFDHETSVRTLVQHCTVEDEKLFLFISSPMSTEKLKVQIRPWRLADADYLVDVNVPINLRRVVFVGGVPRPIRAVELAHIMDRLYGSVACAGIDTDVEYKYPK